MHSMMKSRLISKHSKWRPANGGGVQDCDGQGRGAGMGPTGRRRDHLVASWLHLTPSVDGGPGRGGGRRR
jgi:hypothetical protein